MRLSPPVLASVCVSVFCFLVFFLTRSVRLCSNANTVRVIGATATFANVEAAHRMRQAMTTEF